MESLNILVSWREGKKFSNSNSRKRRKSSQISVFLTEPGLRAMSLKSVEADVKVHLSRRKFPSCDCHTNILDLTFPNLYQFRSVKYLSHSLYVFTFSLKGTELLPISPQSDCKISIRRSLATKYKYTRATFRSHFVWPGQWIIRLLWLKKGQIKWEDLSFVVISQIDGR